MQLFTETTRGIQVLYEFVADWDNMYGGYVQATITHPSGGHMVVVGQTLDEARKQVRLILNDIGEVDS